MEKRIRAESEPHLENIHNTPKYSIILSTNIWIKRCFKIISTVEELSQEFCQLYILIILYNPHQPVVLTCSGTCPGGWVAGVIENLAISAQIELELGLSLLYLPNRREDKACPPAQK